MDSIKILNKCFLFLTVLLCLVLCSCKATPNEDYVVSRADESIYQNEESTVVPVKEVEIDSRWNWKEFTYQDTFQGADGKAHVNVDISGKYLDDPVPVLRISHQETGCLLCLQKGPSERSGVSARWPKSYPH